MLFFSLQIENGFLCVHSKHILLIRIRILLFNKHVHFCCISKVWYNYEPFVKNSY